MHGMNRFNLKKQQTKLLLKKIIEKPKYYLTKKSNILVESPIFPYWFYI